MQFIKKASSLIIALSLAIGSGAFCAHAKTEAVTDGKYSYSEDFSAYDSVAFSSATAVTPGNTFNTDWTVSSKYTSDGAFEVYGAKGTPSGSDGAMVAKGKADKIGTVNFKNVAALENGYKFSIQSNYSVINYFWLAEMGVRFMVDEAADTYYEIATAKNQKPVYSFVKKSGGSETVIKTGTTPIQKVDKVSYEVSVSGGEITYSVKNGSTVLLEGTYTDTAPFEYKNTTVPVAAYVYGAQKIEFDNFKLQQLIPYIDTDEPSPVLYQNAVYGKKATADGEKFVYDLGKEYAIRRINAESGADVEISVNGTEYTALAKPADFVGGSFLNKKDITPVRFVRLSTDAAEVYVDTDSLDVSTYVGNGVQFKMYSDKSTDGITWSSNSDSVVVDGGEIIGAKKGNAVVTAKKGTKAYTINVTVGSELDGAIASGNTDAYISKVSDAVSNYDEAIVANDAEALETVVFGTGAGSLADISDFDAAVLDDLTDDEKATLLSGIIASGAVAEGGITTDSVKALIANVNAQAEKAADVTLVEKIKSAVSDAAALRAIVTGDVETSIKITEFVDELVFEEDFTDAQLAEVVNTALADYAEIKAGDGKKLMTDIVGGVNELTKPFVFEDDFSYADGYEAKKTFAPGEQMNDDWSVSSAYNAYGNLKGYLGVSEPYPESGGALSYKGFGKHTGTINLRHIPQLDGKYKIELDQYQYNLSHNDTRMGIRFMVNETNGSYYQILSSTGKDVFTFKKVLNGNEVATSIHASESVVHVRPSKVHYEVTIGGDLIEYKVSCNGKTLLQGAYKDLAPFEYATGIIPLALVAEGDNAPLEIDDVKLTALTKPYTELPEPSPVIYNNVAENASVEGNIITLEEKAAIRRIKFVNDYEACNVRASVDGVTWDNLASASDFAEGQWLNRVSGRKYKYVELANAVEVKLYTDVYADDTYTYYVGTDADIVLYELGEEVNAPVWTVSDTSVATIKNGKLRAKKAGEVTVSIVHNKVELKTNFEIKSKLDEAVANGTVEQYLEELKPAYDEINSAIDADDASTLKTVLKTAAENGDLTDFDGGSITDLTDGALEILADKLVAGGAKGAISTNNVGALYNDLYKYIPQAKAADMIEKTIAAADANDGSAAEAIFDGSSLSAFEKEIEFVPAEDISSVPTSDLALAAKRMAAKYVPFNATTSTLGEDDIQKFMNDAKAEIKNIKACNVVSDANDAIETNDVATLKNIITGNGAGTMGSVEIFDGTAVKALSPEKQAALATRMATYGKFETSGNVNASDVERFIETIAVEYAVGEVSGIADADAFENALKQYNDYLGLPLDDEALKIETDDKGEITVKDETIGILAGKTFNNRDNLFDLFVSDFVLRAFKNMSAYQGVAPLYADYNKYIGGSDAKLAEIIEEEGAEMLTFGTYVINNLDEINTLGDVADLLDNYEIGAEDGIGDGGAGSGGSSGGGFGGGSSGGFAGGSGIAVGTGIINDINANKNVETSVYTDVPTTHWAYSFIKYLNAHGSISGYGDGTFGPENNVKRAEFIKILISELGFTPATVITAEYAETYNAQAVEAAKKADEEAAAKAAEEGKEAPEATVPQLIEATAKPFEDVEITSWYAPYIIAAKDIGLVQGDGTNCNPEANITREEMASVVYRAIKLNGTQLDSINTPKTFADDAYVSDWARASIMQLYKYGIINGVSETEIAPKASATRAQVAKMIGDLSMKITAKEAAVNE